MQQAKVKVTRDGNYVCSLDMEWELAPDADDVRTGVLKSRIDFGFQDGDNVLISPIIPNTGPTCCPGFDHDSAATAIVDGEVERKGRHYIVPITNVEVADVDTAGKDVRSSGDQGHASESDNDNGSAKSTESSDVDSASSGSDADQQATEQKDASAVNKSSANKSKRSKRNIRGRRGTAK